MVCVLSSPYSIGMNGHGMSESFEPPSPKARFFKTREMTLGRCVCFFPKQVYLWGSILEKNRLDTLVGALGLVGRGFGPPGRAGLGWAWGLAVLGALAGLGVGFGRAGRAGWVGRGVGRAGWVGRGVARGVWPCWAR